MPQAIPNALRCRPVQRDAERLAISVRTVLSRRPPCLMQNANDPYLGRAQPVVDVVGIASKDELARASGPERTAEKRVTTELFGALNDVLDDLECGVRVLSREI